MKSLIILMLTMSALFSISSCKQDPKTVVPPVSNEVLTTTILNLVNANDSTDKPFISYKIIGANPVVINPDSLRLKANATYNCTIVVLDETKIPADTVSNTIKQRANEHMFFFKPSAGLNLMDSITDHDTHVPPLPLGLQSVIKTGKAGFGTLEVILRHQPNVKDGTYPPGDTDLDVSFPVKIR